MDAFYNDPNAMAAASKRPTEGSGPSTSKLNALFEQYKGAHIHSWRFTLFEYIHDRLGRR